MTWLLDLRSLRPGEEDVSLTFAHPAPAWVWAISALVAGGAAWLGYRKLGGPRAWRIALAGFRAALVLVIALLLSGPQLTRPNESEEKDWVVVLADRSASMTVADGPAASGGPRMTRDEELRRALDAAGPALARLGKDRELVLLGFDSGVFDLAHADGLQGMEIELPDAGGRRTSIAGALSQTLRRAAARPLSGVVILSDGRSMDEPGRAAVRQLQADHVPVFAVPLGSATALRDVAVRSVRAPRAAFTNDMVPVEVVVERSGPDDAGGASVVKLIDNATGLALTQQEIEFEDGSSSARITLLTRRSSSGAADWSVVVDPGGDDLLPDNNRSDVRLELIDRQLRVLLLDGQPRWEYRYLRNLFLRETTVRSSSLLVAPGRRFLQEGDEVIPTIPVSPEDWRAFDVVVLGDVRPDVLTPDQVERIKERVGVGGGGLLMVAGDGYMPRAWKGTPLEELLPFTLTDSADASVRRSPTPVTVAPTPAAERLGVMRLLDVPGADGSWWPGELSDPAMGWSRLYWSQRIERDRLKPATEVLAVALAAGSGAGGAAEAEGGAAPLVLSMRYGAGRVVYVATDEIWRWRYGRGEVLQERFYLQLVRLLARESLSRAGRAAALDVSPRRATTGEAVALRVSLLDQSLVDEAPRMVRLRLTRVGDAGTSVLDRMGPRTPTEPPIDLVLTPDGGGGGGRDFAATWSPSRSGAYLVEPADSLLAGAGLRDEVQVWLPDDELREPETDHGLLSRLAEATGGRVLSIDELDGLPDLLPNRRTVITGAPDVETLWDTPLALIVVMTLLVAEWVGRRLIRLV